MKFFLVILLSLQLLMGNILLPELAKIPALFEHFAVHQAGNHDLNFFTFLKMHYADPDHQSSDKHHHDSLPLKSANTAHAEIFNFSTIDTPSVFSSNFTMQATPQSIVAYQNPFLSSLHGCTIFQPPRVG